MIDLASIDLLTIVKILGTVIGTFVAAKIISFLLRKLFDKTPFPEKIENAIVSLSKYLTWLIGFFVMLGVVGVELTNIIVGIGAFSIAISFATKDIVQNLVSGLLILADRPFRKRDRIKVKTHEGVVKKVGLRSTTLLEDDGDLVIIPNTMLVTNPVKKYKREKKAKKK